MSDADIPDEVKVDAIKTKGYFIYPSQLFVNVAKSANSNESLNTDLAAIFAAIEASASGYPSEEDIRGLFADFDTTSNRLGNTVKHKNERLAKVLKGVAGLPLKFDDNEGDLFGDAYEFLISNYAANAGKSGGEFFTPQHVSKLIAQLAMHKQTSVNKIYDPAAGSGSLLLQAKKHFDEHIIEDGFFGQEIIRLRPTHPNHVWAIDFVHDKLSNGRPYKMLTVLDEYTREALCVAVRPKINASDVLEVLHRLLMKHGKPEFIRSDNGPEFIAAQLQDWLRRVGIQTMQIYPGSPWENGYNERFNGTLRREVLNAEWFHSTKQAQVVINVWLRQYNQIRPHHALRMRLPVPEALLETPQISGTETGG